MRSTDGFPDVPRNRSGGVRIDVNDPGSVRARQPARAVVTTTLLVEQCRAYPVCQAGRPDGQDGTSCPARSIENNFYRMIRRDSGVCGRFFAAMGLCDHQLGY